MSERKCVEVEITDGCPNPNPVTLYPDYVVWWTNRDGIPYRIGGLPNIFVDGNGPFDVDPGKKSLPRTVRENEIEAKHGYIIVPAVCKKEPLVPPPEIWIEN
jgi:hypothetical protein